MIARVRRAVSDQLSRPTGRGGRVIAVLMNRGNRDMNGRALDLLDVRDGVRVLDLGFGGALTFEPLLARGAQVVGVDRAGDMVDAAASTYRGDARVAVHQGDVEALPLEDASVDRVLTVNTVYFWPDLAMAFAEVRRVLTAGGRLVIGIRDGSVMRQVSPEVFTVRAPDELAATLRSSGFDEVAIHTADDGATHLIAATRT